MHFSVLILLGLTGSTVYASENGTEKLDTESCHKIPFKEQDWNCTTVAGETESKNGTYPILGNCTAYLKCVFVPSEGLSLPEVIQTCAKGQIYDTETEGCVINKNSATTCPQIDCETVLESENTGNSTKDGSTSGKYVNEPKPGQGAHDEKSHPDHHEGHDKPIVLGGSGRKDDTEAEQKKEHEDHKNAAISFKALPLAIISIVGLL